VNITKIKIKNLFGIKEIELDGSSVEITGTNGKGKTSIIDAIRYALTNSSSRDYIIRNGEAEGEIIIETDTGLTLDRKKRTTQADYKSLKEGNRVVTSPESFLQTLFSPLQINPVEFIAMSKHEQNRIILNLIEFDWDINWIVSQFGELPPGVNYDQHILSVLNDIQSESGNYFQRRQDINRDMRNKRAFVEDIAKDIPTNYQADVWESYDVDAKYSALTEANSYNDKIQRAKMFRDSYQNKVRGYQAERDIAISNHEKSIATERDGLTSKIERLKAEIIAAQDTLATLDGKLSDKKAVEQSGYEVKIAQLDKDMGIADEYADKQPKDVSTITAEIETAKAMTKHLNEYRRMKTMQSEIDGLSSTSEELTRKIELARTLPGEILKTATIPVDGLTVENGVPLVRGLPVSNLSDGEKLDLCVDVAISKPNSLQLLLIDGVEKLGEDNRKKLYKKCKDRGVQFIATRTTNDDELEVTTL
jgi:DNA repair exonuclease SbcCD ATPase subunit